MISGINQDALLGGSNNDFLLAEKVISLGNFLEFCLWSTEVHAQPFIVTKFLV